MKSNMRRNPNEGDRSSRDSDGERLGNSVGGQSASRHSKSRRTATLYDAVAGRVGLKGFLKVQQLETGQVQPSTPEEVLLRRVSAPDRISHDYYNADQRLTDSQTLPDSELLKDVHSYVADYYELANRDARKVDFQSFDETALLAMGILLEEACRESIGDNGDMVFSEPAIRDQQALRSRMAQHQVIGKVIPHPVQEYQSSSEERSDASESRPKKRARRHYFQPDDE